jgi:hypothetical protein
MPKYRKRDYKENSRKNKNEDFRKIRKVDQSKKPKYNKNLSRLIDQLNNNYEDNFLYEEGQ